MPKELLMAIAVSFHFITRTRNIEYSPMFKHILKIFPQICYNVLYNLKIILLFKLRRSRATVAVERLHLANVAVPTQLQ